MSCYRGFIYGISLKGNHGINQNNIFVKCHLFLKIYFDIEVNKCN